MKIQQILIIIIFTIPVFSFSQSENYDLLVKQVCADLNIEKIKNLPPDKIQKELINLGTEIRNKNNVIADKIASEIKENNPSYNDSEILREYLTSFYFHAIDNCSDFYELTLIPLGDCPKSNNTLTLLENETEKFINNNSDKDFKELNDLLVRHLTTIIFDNIPTVETDYKDGIADPLLMSDMTNYLFHKSKDYLKINIAIQIGKYIGN